MRDARQTESKDPAAAFLRRVLDVRDLTYLRVNARKCLHVWVHTRTHTHACTHV